MAAKTIAFVNKNDAGSTVRTYNLPFGKYDATAAPGVSDDDTAGYIAGSKWVDRTHHKVYECTDNSTGAAVWLLLGSLSDGTYGDIVVSSSGATWTIGSTMVQDIISLTDPGADKLAFWDDSAGHIAWLTLGTNLSITGTTIDATGGGGLSDGDYGDITVGGSGTTMTIDAGVVTYAKLQDVSATSRILGRKTSGAGDAEECTLSEVLDFIGSAAQGDLLYRGASAWTRLAAPSSAAGQQLRHGGTGTNPGWVDGHGPSMVQNLNLYASASAGALTIEVKTNGGTDPTSTDYCVIPFRSVGTSVGYMKYRQITGAKTLVIPSGATLGATSGVPFRVWVGAVDSLVDAFPETGTIQLFAINCYDGASTIYPLRDNQTANPTAIGTGSDSAGAMYSPATVSGGARAIRVLGYFEWPSGLTTAGTWTFASTDIAQLYHAGVPLPGDVIQAVPHVRTDVVNTTTTVGNDDTIMQSTEGTELFSKSITPRSAANMIELRAEIYIGITSGGHCYIGFFKDSGADAICAGWGAENVFAPTMLTHRLIAGGTSSITFAFRAGPNSTNGGTMSMNGYSSSRYGGGAVASHQMIREIMT